MKSSRMIHRAAIETLESRRLLSFAAPVSYPVGGSPGSVATGDFNGDGRSDVVTTSPAGNNISVLLSNANGTLQAAQQFATGANPSSVAVGDVNNDGRRDIITANGGGNLSVLLGNGNGTFQPALSVTLPPQQPPSYSTTTTPVPQTPVSVVVGDLNADGKLDLVVNALIAFDVVYSSYYGGWWYSQQTTGQVNVLLGNGNGTFATANSYAAAYSNMNSIGVGDFNNDTKLDVVSGPSNSVWLGNGNGTLQQPIQQNTYAPSWASGDFDSDGKLDLVTAASGSYFLKGLGTGTLQAPVSIPLVGSGRSVVAGDVNGDGKLDLVVSTTKTTWEYYGYYGATGPTTIEYTKVLLGKGDGTFTRGISTTLGTYPDPGNWPNASALGDFNGDSRPDLVATDPRTGKIYVQLNEVGWLIPGTLSISDAAAVTEGNTGTVNSVFTVTLAEAPAANVTVKYEVSDGSATLAGGDFAATSGTLTFLSGQTTKTITVPVKGDRVGEQDEYFYVNLSDPTNADVIREKGTGIIIDNEPRVSISGGQVTEGNSGTLPLTFTATLSAASDAPVTVSYRTVDSSAVGTTDYVPVASSVTFALGQTTRTFTVQVKGDLVPEYQENFYVILTDATNALVVVNEAAGTINDTDPDPTISIANVTRAEGGPGAETEFQFVLSLSKPSEKTVSVNYATAAGTATSSGQNKDYFANSSSVSFYPGQMFASVYIYVIGDSRNESDETFSVNLSNPTAATIADNQAVGTILNDETRGKKWIGPATGGNWSTASNWSPSGVPGATSYVRVENASVSISSSITVAELSLVNDAALTVAPGGGKVVRTPALFIDYSTLNLNDNNLIVDYTAGNSPLGAWNRWGYIGVSGMIGFGSNGGFYNGAGIITTQPDALAGRTGFGVGEASQILGLTGSQNGLFSGQTVDATTILVKYTYRGDANLDGGLDVDDYTAIDLGISDARNGWSNGDFNYDGKLNIDDYVIIDSIIRSQGSVFANAVTASTFAVDAVTRPRVDWSKVEKRDEAMIDLVA